MCNHVLWLFEGFTLVFYLTQTHMIKPKVKYTFDIKDATLFYSDYDHSMNFETQDSCEFDDGVTICGVEPESVFMMCRNVLACREPIQNKLTVRDWHITSAKEMITALEKFIESQEDK